MFKMSVKRTMIAKIMAAALAVSLLSCGCMTARSETLADPSGEAATEEVQPEETEEWYVDNKLICHALGKVDDYTYLNCKEGLEQNYEKGFKVFECDLALTSDGGLVAVHDWNDWKNTLPEVTFEGDIPTKEEFLNSHMFGQYTGLCIEDILLFLHEHPETYLVTDTKETRAEGYNSEFSVLLGAAEELGCTDVLDRIIVQIYHNYMYDDIYGLYPFKNWIYTLYQEDFAGEPDKFESYAEYCNENDIPVITMWEYLYSDELGALAKEHNIQIFVHTVNDQAKKESFLEKGVGVYTDVY